MRNWRMTWRNAYSIWAFQPIYLAVLANIVLCTNEGSSDNLMMMMMTIILHSHCAICIVDVTVLVRYCNQCIVFKFLSNWRIRLPRWHHRISISAKCLLMSAANYEQNTNLKIIPFLIVPYLFLLVVSFISSGMSANQSIRQTCSIYFVLCVCIYGYSALVHIIQRLLNIAPTSFEWIAFNSENVAKIIIIGLRSVWKVEQRGDRGGDGGAQRGDWWQ